MARKLRIAVSVIFGVLTLALALIWITSQVRMILIQGRLPGNRTFAFYTLRDNSTLYTYDGHLEWGVLTSGDPVGFHFANPTAEDLKASYQGLPNFKFRRLPSFSLLVVPSIFLTAIPWIGSAKRFSLRTLLIAITLVSVALGAVAWMVG